MALFPNYRNFQPASDEDSAILDAVLVAALRAKDYGKVELCIPEFLSEEDYRFSYSNKAKLENTIYSFLEPKQIEKVFKTPEAITVEHLQNKRIYAYSAAEDRVLGYRHWSIYDCLVYEHELDDRYFILNDGRWVQVDPEFYNSIIEFIANRVQEEAPEDWYLNIDITDDATKTNSEAIFNAQIVDLRPIRPRQAPDWCRPQGQGVLRCSRPTRQRRGADNKCQTVQGRVIYQLPVLSGKILLRSVPQR
ncbi:TIGR04141 family sporadically distributed protein [Mesorhizobium australicum]